MQKQIMFKAIVRHVSKIGNIHYLKSKKHLSKFNCLGKNTVLVIG